MFAQDLGPGGLPSEQPDFSVLSMARPDQDACISAQFLCGGRDANGGLAVKEDASSGGYRYCGA